MNKSTLIIGILLTCFQSVFGQDAGQKKTTHGILFMAGGRYDNLRMCVGSPAGVKGGPIADFMWVTRKHFDKNRSLRFNLPFMRPILFGLAFQMLQFEPEATLEFEKQVSDNVGLTTGPGVGISLHYGPDYRSSLIDRGASFFAMGPIVSWQTGLALQKDGLTKSVAGLKAFYVPLFAQDRPTGTVLGGAFTYTRYL